MRNEESNSDVVKEARELLNSGALLLPLRVEGWHKSLTDGGWFIRHVTGRALATVEFVPVEIETGRPALDWSYSDARCLQSSTTLSEIRSNAPNRSQVSLLRS